MLKIDHSQDDAYLAVTKLLECRNAYPERPEHVERIDTHISTVFLSDQYAYKLKKPVKFDFLDYSSIAHRYRACQEEIRVNSRMAPGVYVDVIPIVRTADNSLKLNGHGEPVDWVVRMRRLPSNATLAHLIHAGQVTYEHVHSIVKLLQRFYHSTSRLEISPQTYRAEILRHVSANRAELLDISHHLSESIVKRVHSAQLRFLRLTPEMIDDRVRSHQIVDGHGDLRPEHVYFVPDPVVIDGIEFNAELRHLDVLDELCFLAMECAAQGAEAIGEQILAGFCLAANAHPSIKLVKFYKCYRACVRSKVAALRASQLDGNAQEEMLESARTYLTLADRYAADFGLPLLIMVWGGSGTGKSSIAEEVAQQLGCELLQTDKLRLELFGSQQSPSAYDAERYSPTNREQVYNEMFDRAEKLLTNGMSIVMDGTFLSAQHRQRAFDLAAGPTAQWASIYCHCPSDVAIKRIRARAESGSSISDFRPEFFARQRQSMEITSTPVITCSVDTTNGIPHIVQQVFDSLSNANRTSSC